MECWNPWAEYSIRKTQIRICRGGNRKYGNEKSNVDADVREKYHLLKFHSTHKIKTYTKEIQHLQERYRNMQLKSQRWIYDTEIHSLLAMQLVWLKNFVDIESSVLLILPTDATVWCCSVNNRNTIGNVQWPTVFFRGTVNSSDEGTAEQPALFEFNLYTAWSYVSANSAVYFDATVAYKSHASFISYRYMRFFLPASNICFLSVIVLTILQILSRMRCFNFLP